MPLFARKMIVNRLGIAPGEYLSGTQVLGGALRFFGSPPANHLDKSLFTKKGSFRAGFDTWIGPKSNYRLENPSECNHLIPKKIAKTNIPHCFRGVEKIRQGLWIIGGQQKSSRAKVSLVSLRCKRHQPPKRIRHRPRPSA